MAQKKGGKRTAPTEEGKKRGPLTPNLGQTDRMLRAIFASILVIVGFFFERGLASIAMYALAGLLVVTSLAGISPLYKLLGLETSGK